MQDTQLALRLATADDAIPLAALLERVFTATYGSAIPVATLQSYQERVFSPDAIAAQLARRDTPAVCGRSATSARTDRAELKRDYTPRIAAIFDEDRAIVESQRPELLPLDLQAELHLRSDRIAIAYRSWLRQLGVRFGTA